MILPFLKSLISLCALLSWNQALDPSVTAYKLYYGDMPGTYDGGNFLVGNYLNYGIRGLAPNTPYFFAVTAVSPQGESTFSNEIEIFQQNFQSSLSLLPTGVLQVNGFEGGNFQIEQEQDLMSGNWTNFATFTMTSDTAQIPISMNLAQNFFRLVMLSHSPLIGFNILAPNGVTNLTYQIQPSPGPQPQIIKAKTQIVLTDAMKSRLKNLPPPPSLPMPGVATNAVVTNTIGVKK